KMTLAYGVADGTRHVRVALTDFRADEPDPPLATTITYQLAPGAGGLIELVARGDFFSRGPEGQVARGADGMPELARIALGWASGKGGRAAVAICDPPELLVKGCLGLHQCWDGAGNVSF